MPIAEHFKRCCFPILAALLVALYRGAIVVKKLVYKLLSAIWYAGIRYRVRTRRIPKSKPLATAAAEPQTPKIQNSATSFLHLPLEIRLDIYRRALAGPSIVQVGPGSPRWGPQPASWDPAQHIRSDKDLPSNTLYDTIALGGSPVKQIVAPLSQGCVRHSAINELLCGEQHCYVPGWVRMRQDGFVFPSDLMRASRAIYTDILDQLYATNTISLFGVEMVHYFLRNASPEGLGCVRYVHVALLVSSDSWDSWRERRAIEGAVRTLRGALTVLLQLDVEVAVKWGQPKNPDQFWAWMRDDVLGQFQGLDRFALKMNVYNEVPFFIDERRNSESRRGREDLSSWDSADYKALKAKITAPGRPGGGGIV